MGTEWHDRAAAADLGRRSSVDDVRSETPELGAGPDLVERLVADPAEWPLVRGGGVAACEHLTVLVDERYLPRHQTPPRDFLVPRIEAVVALPRDVRGGEVSDGTVGDGQIEANAVLGATHFDRFEERGHFGMVEKALVDAVVVVVDDRLYCVPAHTDLGEQWREVDERLERLEHRDRRHHHAFGPVDLGHEVAQPIEGTVDVAAPDGAVHVRVG
jgi:hypothetical protein